MFKPMKLKHIVKYLCAFFSAILLISCNESDTYETISPYADAQIYSLAVSAKPSTRIDTLTYPALAKTRFSIDQYASYIYNPDSLPYRTELRKVQLTLGYSQYRPSQLELIYSDTLINWNGNDSIDFTDEIPRLRVTAQNMTSTKEYRLDVRIHQVDPDMLVWWQSTDQPSTVQNQKTLLKDGTFYTFSQEGNTLNLYTAAKASSLAWSGAQATSGIDGASIVLGSITLFNGSFYAVDSNMNAYTSTDGIAWTATASGVYNIIGVAPGTIEADDVLLTIVQDAAGDKYYATTQDMVTLTVVEEITTNPTSNQVSSNFPVSGFSAVTNYNRANPNNNLLAVTGGTTLAGNLTNLTWSVIFRNGRFEIMPTQSNSTFVAKNGTPTFIYDNHLYAMVNNTFFKSQSWGYRWTAPGSQEAPSSGMPLAYGQSVIVDEENYIWVFGGMLNRDDSYVRQVWRGRINRLAVR